MSRWRRQVATACIFCGLAAQAAPAPAGLEQLLGKAAKQMETFRAGATSVTCTERVRQEKLGPKGKVESARQQSDSFVLLVELSGDRMVVEETRAPLGGESKQPAQPLLLTNGFSTLNLIFHSYYQGSFEFREEVAPAATGEGLRMVEFRHLGGTRSPSALELKGKEYPLSWRGTAWLDSSSGAVTRMHAELAEPMPDLGLESLEATVVYEPVEFRAPRQTAWLPKSITVEARTRRQHWRNFLEYSGYRRFNVTTQVEMADPVAQPKRNGNEPDRKNP